MSDEFKIYKNIIGKKYPNIKFAYGVGDLRFKYIFIYTDDKNSQKFCSDIHSWMGKPFRIEFRSELEYERFIFNRKKRNLGIFDSISTIINWFVMFPTTFLIYSYYRASKLVKKMIK